MKTKLKSIITRVVALALTFIAGSSLAVEPVAMWCGDFPTSGTATIGNWTLDLNGNESDGKTITMTSGKLGVLVTRSSSVISPTLIIRYEDLPYYTDDNHGYAFVSTIAAGSNNRVGLYASGTAGRVHAVWNDASNTTGWNASTSTPIPHGGVVGYYYQTGSKTDLYNNGNYAIYSNTSLKGGSDNTNTGFAIGGLRGSSNATILTAVGMRITGIAVFDSVLTAAEISSYVWPDEYVFSNINCGVTTYGVGGYGLSSFKIPTSCGLPEGTELKIKSIAFAQETGKAWNFSAEFIKLNDIQSDSRNDGSQTLTAWSLGNKLEYKFSSEVIVKVGTSYSMGIVQGNGSNNSLRIRLFKTAEESYAYITQSADQAYRPAYMIVAEPVAPVATATASIGSDINWSKIDWDEGVAPEAISPVELTFNDSYTLTLDEAAVGRGFLLKGISSAEQTIKITGSAANVAAFVGKVTFDDSFTGKIECELDATTASFTADMAFLSKIKAAGNGDKFTFIGEGSNGVSLDFNAANNNTTLQSHLVFKGGTHLFKHNQAQNSQFGRT